MAVLDPTRVISGNYAYVYDENGDWLTNVMNVEASIDIGKEDIQRAGTRWIGKKTTTLEGSGSIGGYKITSDFLKMVARAAEDNAPPFVTEFIIKLEDPESYGAERIRLKGVQFDNVPLVNAEVGSLVEEEYNFTFDGFELMDEISAQ